jgi:predicted nucleic acid-binding protein
VIVVADTSPLNYLVRLGHTEILHQLYGRVLAPSAVLTEMPHPDAPSEVRAWAAAPPSWLEVATFVNLEPTLPRDLGAGEREAISLALERRADVLLIDEFAGRQQARARQISVAGTLAVLLQAGLRGYLDFPKELGRLRQLRFRASPAIEAEMFDRFYKAQMHNSPPE